MDDKPKAPVATGFGAWLTRVFIGKKAEPVKLIDPKAPIIV